MHELVIGGEGDGLDEVAGVVVAGYEVGVVEV